MDAPTSGGGSNRTALYVLAAVAVGGVLLMRARSSTGNVVQLGGGADEAARLSAASSVAGSVLSYAAQHDAAQSAETLASGANARDITLAGIQASINKYATDASVAVSEQQSALEESALTHAENLARIDQATQEALAKTAGKTATTQQAYTTFGTLADLLASALLGHYLPKTGGTTGGTTGTKPTSTGTPTGGGIPWGYA